MLTVTQRINSISVAPDTQRAASIGAEAAFAARVEYLTQLDWTLMTYLFLLGLAHALEYRRESERRALDHAHLETRQRLVDVAAFDSPGDRHEIFQVDVAGAAE